ncbi:MAG: hypothetical protein JKY34_16435 [Kordiimonadaceae bacterium]|nr:hypothetical protein [Kordiimonadaceae bacterium]
MYIEEAGVNPVASKGAKIPRERSLNGIEGLFKLYDLDFDEQSVMVGDKLTNAELLDSLDQPTTNLLKSSDPVVLSHWGPEFDPDYYALGPYIGQRFGLDSTIFDVIDRGSLSPLVALHVLHRVMEGDKLTAEGSFRSALFAFQQNTVPLPKNSKAMVPETSGLGYLFLTQEKTGNLRIVDIQEFDAGLLAQNPASLYEEIQTIIREIRENSTHPIRIFSRRSSHINKLLRHQKTTDSWFDGRGVSLCDWSSEVSSLALFSFLSHLNASFEPGQILYIEEDFETMAFGVLVLEVSQNG